MLSIGVVVIAGGILLAVFGQGNRTPADRQQLVDMNLAVGQASHVTGNPGAAVTLVEFGDFQCPACSAAEPAIKQILSQYGGQIRFIFRNFPLPMHQNAMIAAEAAEAAGNQGKYFEMHDKLYETQDQWSTRQNPLDTFVGYAQILGLNVEQFKQAVQQNKFAALISQDETAGNRLGINATPTFILDGQLFVGVPDQTLVNAIVTELKK